MEAATVPEPFAGTVPIPVWHSLYHATGDPTAAGTAEAASHADRRSIVCGAWNTGTPVSPVFTAASYADHPSIVRGAYLERSNTRLLSFHSC